MNRKLKLYKASNVITDNAFSTTQSDTVVAEKSDEQRAMEILLGVEPVTTETKGEPRKASVGESELVAKARELRQQLNVLIGEKK